MGALLVVAAEPRELAGIRGRCRDVRRLNCPLWYAREAVLNGRRLLLAANGHGPHLAGEAVDAIAKIEQPEALLSAGYCGAVAPGLRSGTIVVASRIEAPRYDLQFDARPPDSMRECVVGPIVSVDWVVRTSEEKLSLHATGAVAVEMEAAAVAARAARWWIPFYCVRSVTDTAEEDLGLDLNAARDAGGRLRTGRIVAQACRNPFLLPELLTLWWRSRLAAERLGDFLADCRF